MKLQGAVTCSFIHIISSRLERLFRQEGYSRCPLCWAVMESGKSFSAEGHKFPAHFSELSSAQRVLPSKLLLKVTWFRCAAGQTGG